MAKKRINPLDDPNSLPWSEDDKRSMYHEHAFHRPTARKTWEEDRDQVHLAMTNHGLFYSGIQTEKSDIRIHVSMSTKELYIFDTEDGVKTIKRINPKWTVNGQNGVVGMTALGYLVPFKEISSLRTVSFPEWPKWSEFEESLPTPIKGLLAEQCVNAQIEKNPRPIYGDRLTLEQVRDRKTQIKGTDIIIRCCNLTISVKCDAASGKTGNLFLQWAERNPLKLHTHEE